MAEPELLQPKLVSYLNSTWYTRWIIIGIVAASIWFVPTRHLHVILVLVVLAVIYNAVLKLVERAGHGNLPHRTSMLVMDGGLSVVLVMLTGGIISPYIVILPFMVITSGYWYGSLAAAVVGVSEALALLVYGLAFEPGERTHVKIFLTQMAVLVSIGLYVGWVSKSERHERSELLELETETENERRRLTALINNLS
ncbi:MAG: hypothetical protein ACREHG_03100, partial [Candidatus Saccharimonadales bacterium]